MSFVGTQFLAFFAIVAVLYWLLGAKPRKVLLLVSSYAFYAVWDWRFAGLLVLTTLVDFGAGAGVEAASSRAGRRAYVGSSLAVNLGVLCFFKYSDFFAGSLASLGRALGIDVSWTALHLALPVGVSFYTFRSLSYTLDVYRGHMKATRSLLDYAVFVAFFPLLGAGPIVRARRFLPQLEKERRFSLESLEAGLSRFLLGFCKKVFIADTLAVYLVDPVFAQPADRSTAVLWLALAGYTVQIYADFSGYSSMAIGCSRMLGFKVQENFAFPYLARNASEFWRRWHISLTSWFHDYLWWPMAKKIPFAGSLTIRLRWSGSLVLVFLVSGLWHGAGWTFVVWGGLHGAYLVIYQFWRAWRERGPGESRKRSALLSVLPGWVLTQVGVGLAWLVFRSRDAADAWAYLCGLAGFAGSAPLVVPLAVWVALAAFLVDHAAGWMMEHEPDVKTRIPAPLRAIGYVAILVLVYHGQPSYGSRFIYFQF